jgi:hypothetical protein
MTVYEIVNRVWQDVGEPSDIDPTDDSTYMVATLNRSMEAMMSWKGFTGRRKVLFPDYVGFTYTKNLRETEVIATYDSTDDIFTLVSDPSTFTVAEGDYVFFNDEYRLIFDNTTGGYWLSSAFSTDPVATDSVVLCQKILNPGIDRVKTYLKVENIETQVTLSRMSSRTTDLDNITSSGEPTSWRRNAGRIEFNIIPDDTYVWRVWYYRFPTLATVADYTGMTVEPDCPEDFQLAVMAYMRSMIYHHMQEVDEASNAYRVFDNLMKTTIGSWEQENQLVGGGQVGIEVG